MQDSGSAVKQDRTCPASSLRNETKEGRARREAWAAEEAVAAIESARRYPKQLLPGRRTLKEQGRSPSFAQMAALCRAMSVSPMKLTRDGPALPDSGSGVRSKRPKAKFSR